ncbi:dihydropteroate synthase [Pseudanabaena sp. FACHB-2040]|uniref:dihydropteroate synthase n=1 Tax=Pseudanabaena sp. FACHB-2040 TaxID=2692859 RepID=UPI001685D4CF|nr:dihydropteroate synthase [Pseudanabaena sp. FACHB-2040]MBD2259273.1 dihydropteroate synthase [Pseudanabaena sp. FACHB-2040]
MTTQTLPRPWKIRDRTFNWGSRTYLMGILNVTPDSFSDGGQFNSVEAALAQARHLAKTGTDILDIGGQSTRPGAEEIALADELNRVVPVIQAIRADSDEVVRTVPISVDTTRFEVARAAVRAGADIVNDISAGTFDKAMLSTVADLGVPIILMHMRGTPATMMQHTHYDDLIGDISEFLQHQINDAIAVGVNPSMIAVDPGIGFAKTYPQNLELLRRLRDFHSLGCPLLVGPSRKRFIGWILDQPDPQQRVWGTAAACCAAIAGGADILRVHDGPEMHDVLQVADAVWRSAADQGR